jgi:hypothetical protein
MPAADLIALVAELGATYGLERSVKIAPGQLLDDRYLLSVHRMALGDAPDERLAELGRNLSVPGDVADRLSAALEGADVVHFGHETSRGHTIRKIYFEYTAQVRRAMKVGEPALVHLAYKWVLGSAGAASVTRYTWLPLATRRDLEAKVRMMLPEDAAPRGLRCLLNVIARAADQTDPGELMMMEVEEPGNPRRSCDLNLYDARLRVGQISDVIASTARDFAIPQPGAEALVRGAEGLALGHLSAGIGRDGEEFVTIYYGVEAH